MLNSLVSQTQVETIKPVEDSWKNDIENVLSQLQEAIDSINSQVVTEQAVTDKLTVNETLNATDGEIDALRSDHATIKRIDVDLVDAERLDATQANLQNIKAESINADVATLKKLNLNDDLQTNNIKAKDIKSTTATISSLSTDDINTKTVTSNIISSKEAVLDDITSKTIKTKDVSTDNVTTKTVTTDDITTETLTSETTETDRLTSKEAVINDLDNDTLKNVKIVSKGKLNLDPEQATVFDWYAVTLDYANFVSYLSADFTGLNGQEHKWHITTVGTEKAAVIAYDQDSLNVIKDISFDKTSGKVRIRFNGTEYLHYWLTAREEKNLQIEYNADSFENIFVPTKRSGYVFQGYDDLSSQLYFGGEAEFYSLKAKFQEFDKLMAEDIYITKNFYLPTGYDPDTGTVLSFEQGSKGQYIANREVEIAGEKQIYAKWESPVDYPEHSDKLITAEGVAQYDGSITTDETTEYPLKHLQNDSIVHGDVTVERDIYTQGLTTEKTAIFDRADSGLEKVDGFNIVDGIASRQKTESGVVKEDLVAFKGVVEDDKVVVYDQDTDTFKTTDNVTAKTGAFTTLQADKAYIKELDVVKEETISSTADFVTLRANKDSSLVSGETSGLLVNNYDGNHSLALVTDNTGTARVGTGSLSDTTYADLYYASNKWYSDSALTAEVNPVGALTKWDSVEETDDYIHYKNAVFSKVDFTDLQALLTRDEESNLNDKGLLIYDKTSHKAITIPLPTSSEQILTTTITGGVVSYNWINKQPGIYNFATMSDYNNYTGNIPEGSIVNIENINNYLKGEDQ